MKINPIGYTNYFAPKSLTDTAFGAKKMLDLNIRKLTPVYNYEFAPATLYKYDSYDSDDMLEVFSFDDIWYKTLYANIYVNNFYYNRKAMPNYVEENKFFAIKFTDDDDTEKPLSIMQTKDNETIYNGRITQCLEVMVLQSAPDIEKRKAGDVPAHPPIKGAGELMIYWAVKMAKESGKKIVILQSTNDTFYEKLGFVSNHGNPVTERFYDYYLTSDKYDEFLKCIEKKYNF